MVSAQQFSGVGDPNGVVTGNPGDLYQDETGKLYSKASGAGTNTGWTQIASGVFVSGTGAGSAIQNNGSGNVATGTNSLAEGNTTTASAIGAHAEGDHTIAANDGAHAEGTTTQALADASHAEGSNTVVQNGANAGHAEGFNNTVTAAAFAGHVEGQNNTASGTASHAEGGNGTTASGSYSHAQNLTTVASGDSSDAGGDSTQASGYASFARGVGGTASGDESSVFGIQGVALRESQQTLSGGHFAAGGDGQSSRLVLRGTTPGAVANESVELKFGFGATPTDELLLENGKAYAFKIRAVAYATDTNFASFESSLFSANQEGGVITVKPNPPTSVPLVSGTAGASTWTITVTVGAAPTRITITFATGAGTTSHARVVADVEFVEVAHA